MQDQYWLSCERLPVEVLFSCLCDGLLRITYAKMLVTTQWPMKRAAHLTSLIWICVLWWPESLMELSALWVAVNRDRNIRELVDSLSVLTVANYRYISNEGEGGHNFWTQRYLDIRILNKLLVNMSLQKIRLSTCTQTHTHTHWSLYICRSYVFCTATTPTQSLHPHPHHHQTLPLSNR